MISQTVEYALRAIITIAQNKGQPCTAQKISELAQVPAPYLSKLMQGLVHKGLVRSQRGWHGGFVLTKKPREMTVWEIVQAVTPFKRISECPLGIKSHRSQFCSLHRCLNEATKMVEELFQDTTIEDILTDPDGTSPLREDRQFPSNGTSHSGHGAS